MKAKGNLIVDLTFEFALGIVEITGKLESQKKFAIANQLCKSGTSVGANVREAQSSESRNDFIHKMKIASKEAEETEYWLLLCKHSDLLPDPGILFEKIKTIQRILTSIITTAKSRQ